MEKVSLIFNAVPSTAWLQFLSKDFGRIVEKAVFYEMDSRSLALGAGRRDADGLLLADAKYLSGGQFWHAIAHFRWIYELPLPALTLLYVTIRGVRFGVPLHYLARLNRLTAGVASAAGE